MKHLLLLLIFLVVLARPTLVLAAGNYGVAFNGTNERFLMDARMPPLGTIFTVETFFRWDGRAQLQYQAVINRQWYSNQEWGIFLNADNGNLGATVNYDGQHSGSQSVWLGGNGTLNKVAVGQWSHVALVGTGSQFLFYVNGSLADNKPQTGAPLLPTTNTPQVSAGGLHEGAEAEPFNGAIDEMRISSTARYTGTTYAMPNTEWTSDTSTVGLWHFNEGTGSQSADSGPHSYTAKMYTGGQITAARWTTGYPFFVAVVSPTPQANLGDVTHDGVVDWQDFIEMTRNLGEVGPSSFDLDQSGTVTIFDLNMWIRSL